jgi:BlaI family penicillinase repressor
MAAIPHITESEWLIMDRLWEKAPRTAAEIVKEIQAEKKLENTTIRTLLRRLVAKEAVGFTVDKYDSKVYHYSPLVARQDCVVEENRHFLSLYYKDNIEKLFSTFVGHTDMTNDEINSLKQLLEKKQREKEG